MILETLVVGPVQTNCYVVACDSTRQGLVIDPGGNAGGIARTIERLGIDVRRIVLTHFHFDHMTAAEALCESTGAPVTIHESGVPLLADPPELFRLLSPTEPSDLVIEEPLREGDVLTVGTLRLEVRHTPGHSPDGISLWLPGHKLLFSGDALFRGSVGRIDFPGSDHATLLRSIREQILTLPDDTRVFSGHGPETSVGYERRSNPFLR